MELVLVKYPDRKCNKCKHMTPRKGTWCKKHIPKGFGGMLVQYAGKTLEKVMKDTATHGTGIMRITPEDYQAWHCPTHIPFGSVVK